MPVQRGQPGNRPALDIELDRTAQAPALARAAISGFCEGRECSPGSIATLTLLVSEVVTNAVVHPQLVESTTIALHAHVENDAVHIEVRDAGPRFTPQPRNPERVDGGYGLYLVDREALDWGLRPGDTTTVWFQVPRVSP